MKKMDSDIFYKVMRCAGGTYTYQANGDSDNNIEIGFVYTTDDDRVLILHERGKINDVLKKIYDEVCEFIIKNREENELKIEDLNLPEDKAYQLHLKELKLYRQLKNDYYENMSGFDEIELKAMRMLMVKLANFQNAHYDDILKLIKRIEDL